MRAGGVESTNIRTRAARLTHDKHIAARPQFANLLWDPQVVPGDAASFRELRNAYRVGGSDVQRGTVAVTIATGDDGFDQQKPSRRRRADIPAAVRHGAIRGIPVRSTPTTVSGRGRGDPGYSIVPNALGGLPPLAGAAAATGTTDQFLIFPSLDPFARAGLAC